MIMDLNSRQGRLLADIQAPQTHVTSAQKFYCYDPTVFPEPDRFDVNRWLVDDTAALSAMNRNLVVFSTGTRSCIGQK